MFLQVRDDAIGTVRGGDVAELLESVDELKTDIGALGSKIRNLEDDRETMERAGESAPVNTDHVAEIEADIDAKQSYWQTHGGKSRS